MTISVNYQKRKNVNLFNKFQTNKNINLSNIQNYIPIYDKFFLLNNTNWNSINLNNQWSIFDIKETKNLAKCDPIQRLIIEWCLDDKGVNMLYKNNGDDRYPDFKLYKMIARHVHNHTPHTQLERPEFKSFIVIAKPKDFIDINAIPVCV